MMCWVGWLQALAVRDVNFEIVGYTIPYEKWYEWRPELCVEGGW